MMNNCRPPLPLLPVSAFETIASLIGGKTIRRAKQGGNAGDTLIHAGTDCLLKKLNVRVVEKTERPDYLVWGGGGNLGTLHPVSYARRQREFELARKAGISILVLPQSATNDEETFPDDVILFLREECSRKV